MAGECFTLLGNGNVERSTVTIKVNGITAQTNQEDVDKKYEYAFLEQIVTPIYNVVAAVRNLLLTCRKLWIFIQLFLSSQHIVDWLKSLSFIYGNFAISPNVHSETSLIHAGVQE